MPNAATKLADQTIIQQVGILKDAGLTNAKISDLLSDMDTKISRLIRKAPTSFSTARLQSLLSDVRKAIQVVTGELKEAAKVSLKQTAIFSAANAANALDNVFKKSLANPRLSGAQLKQLLTKNAYGGFGPGLDFFKQWTPAAQSAYQRMIMDGVMLGHSKSSLINHIFGSKALNIPKHQVRNWVRTTTAGVANAARFDTWAQNQDLTNGVQWLATLDARTSNICKVLDGKQWDWNMRPIGHGHDYPGPVAHFGERSTQIPILKTWEELSGNKDIGKTLDNLSDDIRESLNGPVSGKMNYEDWLKTQSETIQRAALGPKRWELWKAGKIGIDDLTNSTNVPFNLQDFADQLAKKTGLSPNFIENLTESLLQTNSNDIADFLVEGVSLPDVIREMMTFYHADSGARILNGWLRGSLIDSDFMRAENLTSLKQWLKKWDKFAHINSDDMAVYRGLQIADLDSLGWIPGNVIKDAGLWSVTHERNIAVEFTKITRRGPPRTRVIFEIEVPAGHGSFFSMEGATVFTREAEFVFRPGSAIQIISRKILSDGTVLIRARMLPIQKSALIDDLVSPPKP